MTIFNGHDIGSILGFQSQTMKQEVESQEANYLLNANETELVRYFIDRYRFEPLELHEDNLSVTTREEMIPSERFRQFSNVRPGQFYKKQVVRYHMPFSGDQTLLQCSPQIILRRSENADVVGDEIQFDVIDWNGDAGEVKREWEEFLGRVRSAVGTLSSQVIGFNQRLEQEATEAVQRRKAELLRQSNLVSSLGVPLKKADDVSSTFAVPPLKKKVIIAKPIASTAPFAPEPTLDEASYHDIVKIIHDTGVEIERHPRIYQGKDEETLRDHLLMVLSPHFQSVSGETFNKEGKTDILIRHEGKNLFVAECAIWRGPKDFLGKIGQLLSYLTWRDSKTALICFVQNKDFTNVLGTIKTEVPSHPRFQKAETPVTEGWLRYQFTLPDDQSRPVRLAILCFHMP